MREMMNDRRWMATCVLLLAGALAGCDSQAAGGGSDAGPDPCPVGSARCGDACVTLATDHESCGACGHACGQTEACEAGACVAVCSLDHTRCDGACVDTRFDPQNCGIRCADPLMVLTSRRAYIGRHDGDAIEVGGAGEGVEDEWGDRAGLL